MIAQALDFITKQLTEFLNIRTTGDQTLIRLSGLVTPEGDVSVTENNTLVLSVVNIAEEGSVANRPSLRRGEAGIEKRPPPVYLNIYLLLSTLFKDDQYSKGLQALSLAISFFQQKSRFSAANTEMPEGIEKLSFELVNLDVDNMSRFWGALGARYQPSVIYKMRMLTISEDTIESILPEFKEPAISTLPG